MKNLFSILILAFIMMSCKKEEPVQPTPKIDPVQGYELLLVNGSDYDIPSVTITDSSNYSVVFTDNCYEKIYLPQKDVFYFMVDENSEYIGKVIWQQVNDNHTLTFTHGGISSYSIMAGIDYNPTHCGSVSNLTYDYQITLQWTE